MYETKDAYGLADLNYQLIWNLFYEAFVIESNNASNSKEKHEYERMMQIREELIQALKNPNHPPLITIETIPKTIHRSQYKPTLRRECQLRSHSMQVCI